MRRSRLCPGPRATTRAWRSRKPVRSWGKSIPSVSRRPSSRRYRSVLSAKSCSASVTRPCCSVSASSELVLVECAARREAGPVPEDARAANRQPFAVRHLLEELGVRDVDEAHAAADEEQRPWVRVAARLRRRHVDDDAHPRLDELLGRDAVDVGVVDDRDVLGAEAAHELLRPPAEPRRACVLDEAVHLMAEEMNSLPPSMRSSSSRRCASSSSSIRVYVGSPGTFSTR